MLRTWYRSLERRLLWYDGFVADLTMPFDELRTERHSLVFDQFQIF